MTLELPRLLHPSAVAVVGAGENLGSMGARTLHMIGSYGFEGALYAVNPKGHDSGDYPGFSRVTDLPQTPDLCLVAVPAPVAVEVVRDCAGAGVPFVQVLTSGPEGSFEFDQELLEVVGGTNTRLLGPNCVGTHAPAGGVTFMKEPDPTAGSVAVISQSGGLSIDFVHQAAARGLPVRAIVSIGNCADVSLAELIEAFAADGDTEVIGVYLEGVEDGAAFVSAVRGAVERKPVVVLKGGTSQAGSASAASHTGAVAVAHTTWQSVLRQIGGLEATDPDDLLAKLTVLQGHVPPLVGDGLAVLGNGGGMTVLTTDALERGGLHLAELGRDTMADIDELETPPGSTLGNPSDVPAGSLNAAGPGTLGVVLRRFLADPAVDGALLHFNLVALLNYGDPEVFAEGLGQLLAEGAVPEKPIFAGLRSTPDPRTEHLRQIVMDICAKAGIPTFRTGLEAADAAATARARARWLSYPRGDHADLADVEAGAAERFAESVATARTQDDEVVDFLTTASLLQAYGVAAAPTRGLATADEAAAAVGDLGPVAMKVDAAGLAHKSDVGGVLLAIDDEQRARSAFEQLVALVEQHPSAKLRSVLAQAMLPAGDLELLVGMHRDPVLGAIVVVGLGGVFVEVIGDVAMRLAPIDEAEARTMLDELKGRQLLGEYRGRPARDIAALTTLISRFSRLAEEAPSEVEAIDLNPVLVHAEGEGAAAVDWRIVLR